MKQYKNKTTGETATLIEGHDSFYKLSVGGEVIPLRLIEDSCYWEKVIKQDFEILSLKSLYPYELNIILKFEGERCTHRSDDKNPINTISKSIALKDDKVIIHSVKRLSDGEIFTLGDKTTKGVITEFIINYELGVFGIKTDLHNCWNGSKTFEKVKKPLFTTFDGVELFGGESIHGVTDDFKLCFTSFATKDNIQRCRIFAKKEKAQEYIDLHQPKYSLQQIKDIVEKQGFFGTSLIQYLENENYK